MIRNASKESLQHDLIDSRRGPSGRHVKDKREKLERSRTEYRAAPALAREAGSRILDGIFDSTAILGFCVERKADGRLDRAADDTAYIHSAMKMSRERARYFRERVRNGKPTRDTAEYKHGAVSFISSIPPWQTPTLRRMTEAQRIEVMIQRARIEAEVVERLSGRRMFGASIHFDSATPHSHSHYPKTDEHGNVHPKSVFLTAGGATVGWDRIERTCPGLLGENERRMLRENLAKKYDNGRFLIDVEVARATDAWFEAELIKKLGLENQYARDIETYRSKKARAIREAQYDAHFEQCLERWHKEKVWHYLYNRASREAKLAMWHAIPKEHRAAIRAFLVAARLFYNPAKVLTGLALRHSKLKLTEIFVAPPEKRPPLIR